MLKFILKCYYTISRLVEGYNLPSYFEVLRIFVTFYTYFLVNIILETTSKFEIQIKSKEGELTDSSVKLLYCGSQGKWHLNHLVSALFFIDN